MAKVIAGIMAAIIGLPLLFLVGGLWAALLAWPAMVFVGNASIISDGLIPSLSYWTTFWLTWTATVVVSRVPSSGD